MSNFLTPYEAVLNSAVEAANAYLDLEGGPLILALISELLQDLVANDNHEGATLAIQRVCEAVDVECRWNKEENSENVAVQVWTCLFAEALMEQTESAVEEN